jgi:predicted house-cleaning noncanonical NTP pyrophosphatase (MazG superfamily)
MEQSGASEGKLVRDRIPEFMRAEGLVPIVRMVSGDEHCKALKFKLVEEADEVLTAPPEKLMEEIADVQEVIAALIEAAGIDVDCLREIQEKKREEKGGFEEGVWFEGIQDSSA